ncbi:hypothetical protein MX031_24375, partial [Ralstonia solanacearum]
GGSGLLRRVGQFYIGANKYGAIPVDAEPLYELDTRSQHGLKPDGEEGVGSATARTAGDLGYSVAIEGGVFDGTYAAFIQKGYPAMIAGIYRLRFRVSNPKNAGVKGAWAGIQERNRDAFSLVQTVRTTNQLAPLQAPWDEKETRRAASLRGDGEQENDETANVSAASSHLDCPF